MIFTSHQDFERCARGSADVVGQQQAQELDRTSELLARITLLKDKKPLK
ncbi:MAG: hypothetical protein J7513_16950 [Solirubrobacteraceae bacterium]|nr:hypothetical protein [Solirubrobacteraceae bacterium]